MSSEVPRIAQLTTPHIHVQRDWGDGYTSIGGKAGFALQDLDLTHRSPLSTVKDTGHDPSPAAICAFHDANSEVLWRGQGVNVKVRLP